ncbi:neurotrimin-like isoform X2 [Vespula maculifrons]|uniref:Neurotrimin-like isoform X2 n=1 Tax=Vespula maculifrons TaxID=7453 RepID=A0ABD2C873_VESMC
MKLTTCISIIYLCRYMRSDFSDKFRQIKTETSILQNLNFAVISYCNVNKFRLLTDLDGYWISILLDFDETLLQCYNIIKRGSQPTAMATYLIFNHLRIIHPQFRSKPQSSVLEPSNNKERVLIKNKQKDIRDVSIFGLQARLKDKVFAFQGTKQKLYAEKVFCGSSGQLQAIQLF